ncbi:MAG: NAD-dependent epimerase/dehydratase family protein [Longimicrobiales bacterium]|nr:NAD-dependent epimerase/dehydratase family protein [Longimicrobiales bacterium]
MTSRREFLRNTTLAGGAVALGATPDLLAARGLASPPGVSPDPLPRAPAPASRALAILVLGGTRFLGPHTVQAMLDRGHTVTLFNRGRTHAELFPGVEKLIGDRNGDLRSLEGREWDAVVDIPATNPEWVRLSAGLLKDAARNYLHVSTLSVYSDTSVEGIDEESPVFRPEDVEVPEGEELPYGLAKALAEDEARAAFGDRAIIVRPGLIVGPLDNTDRFTYWPARIDRGGEVLAPSDGSEPAQIIDARDLAAFIVHLVETRTAGTFNAVGPESPMSMEEMLYGIRAVTTGPIDFTWVPWAFLEAQGVRPWSEIPVWVPETPGMVGFSRFSNARALAAGLTFRPLAETARDTLEWHHSRPAEEREAMRAGLSPERERELLRLWHAQNR